MAGLNKVILIGNVGGDPEVRSLANGSKVVNFSLATSESYTDRSGNKQTSTEWHRVELWDNLANIAEQYVRKGDMLYVEGKLRTEKWTDANGVEKTGVRVRGTGLQMLTSRSSGSGQSEANDGGATYASTPKPAATSMPSIDNDSMGDDLPF